MKNRKGFTLVELLAVIAILAILVIIALPNVMGMFNQAKESSFTTELKQIYKVAQQTWMNDSMFNTGERVYSRCDGCSGKELDLSGRTEIKYLIKIDQSGKVVEYYATDGTYQFAYEGDLLATNINGVERVADLEEDDILNIKNNTAYTGDGPKPVSFATDSWATIQKAVQSNNTSAYNVGDTKQIDLGSYGTHTVRIANKSKSDLCNDENHSQTACGFVIEFADVITTHRINPFEQNGQVNGDGAKGGWEHSEIRQFVNNDIYNALPTELKNIIIDTYVVSGYGNADSDVFRTTDKLYYFSFREVKNETNTSAKDSAYTHVLDYYSTYPSNRTVAIKSSNGTPSTWCFRTPVYTTSGRIYYQLFYGVRPSDGWIEQYGACSGVSPAFRIG